MDNKVLKVLYGGISNILKRSLTRIIAGSEGNRKFLIMSGVEEIEDVISFLDLIHDEEGIVGIEKENIIKTIKKIVEYYYGRTVTVENIDKENSINDIVLNIIEQIENNKDNTSS